MSAPSGFKTLAKICGTGTGLTAAGTTSNVLNVDCLDADYCVVDVIMGTQDTTSHIPGTLKISQGETTDTSNHTNIAGCLGGTDFTAIGQTTTENIYRFNIDTRVKSRYLKVTVSPGTTQEIAIVANLFRNKATPAGTTASAYGSSVQNVVDA